MELQEASVIIGRRTFTVSEKSCLQKLVIRNKLHSGAHNALTDIDSKRKAWIRVTQEYNSMEGNSFRTEAQLRKCWDNIKTRRKELLQKRGVLKPREGHVLAGTAQPQCLDDPLMHIKDEQLPWGDSDSDTNTKDFEVAEVSHGTPSPPRESASRLPAAVIPQPQASKFDFRIQDREEELHKLKVAEKVWQLKTLRERHSTAQLEREKVQLEREKAQFERDIAQFHREKAQLELNRAKREDTELFNK